MAKIQGIDIINGNGDNRTAFSLSAMRRETVIDNEETEGSYDDFISGIAGETEPKSNRAKFDMNRLKEGEYVLQPAWSPLSMPSKNETVFNLADDDDVLSVNDGETQ